MKKTIILLIIAFSLVLCSCSNAPKLLEPLGFEENQMTVQQGDMFNIRVTNNVVSRQLYEISVRNDCIIKSVNVFPGDTVKAEEAIMTLDGDSVNEQAEDIDNQIKQMQADNEYLNIIKTNDINILKLELQKLQASGASEEDIAEKNAEITDAENNFYMLKTEQAKEMSELTLQKMASGNYDTDVTSPYDGSVMFLSNWNNGESIKKDTVVAIIGIEGTKVIKGDYVDIENLQNINEIYALRNGKRYEITTNPVTNSEAFVIDVFDEVLQNTYYFNLDDNDLKIGDMINVVIITDKKENVLYIPDDGLYEDVDGYYVYVKNDKGEKKRRDVKIGTIWNTAVEITDGLKKGESIYGK